MSDTALALRGQTVIRTFDDVERAAKAMATSGFFTDSRDAAQAIVKILAGQEMGFGPFASMNGVYIIQGRPSISANLMAAAVKKSGRYNYRIAEMSDTVCTLEFFEGGKPVGVSTFTASDAKKAGTKNLDKYPRNMLFARAMSNGCRWYCPDVFNGSAVYTPEELGANVNEDGELVDVQYTVEPTTTNDKQEQPPEYDEAENATAAFEMEVEGRTHRKETETTRKPNGKPMMMAKIGKNQYPASWARFLAPYTRCDQYEQDGILQKLNLPLNTDPVVVVEKINAYLDEQGK